MLRESRLKFSQQKDHPGIVHDWKDQLLSIYQSTNDIIELQKLAIDLFESNTSTIEYYRIYKQTFSINEWPQICEKIIQKMLLKKQNDNFFGHYFPQELANI